MWGGFELEATNWRGLADSETSESSLSPVTVPLGSPEIFFQEEGEEEEEEDDFPIKALGVTNKILGGGAPVSSDSGKESDSESVEEEAQKEVEEELEEEGEVDDDDKTDEDEGEDDDEVEEVYEDCEDFDSKLDHSWNYLETIEEEEDSGNDSDLERSELETFEMLEQMCLEEESHVEGTPEKQDKIERGTIQSYHEYKKVKEASPEVIGYKNQILLEKDKTGIKIRPLDEGGGLNHSGRIDSSPSLGAAVESEAVVDLRPHSSWAINSEDKEAVGRPLEPMKHDPEVQSQHQVVKIKSALKRGSSSKKRKKHKVQFDETRNKFFEADYVILIREECGGGDCECGGGSDYCYGEDEDDDDGQLSLRQTTTQPLDLQPFDPPMEFVDQLTLSPPDGYKDHCLYKDASPTDEENQDTDSNWNRKETSREDGTTQTTPTSENEDNDENDLPQDLSDKKERYIVETITMTTVTEKRIIREGPAASSVESMERVGASDHHLHQGAYHIPRHQKESSLTSSTTTATATVKDNEMTLTFKVGTNSLKPNSALRQLFPRIASPPPDKSPDSDDDSLQSNLIKRTIERNTLRRSLVRYPDLKKRSQAKKNENSLVERIKKLTCDIEEEERTSPLGEEPTDEGKPVPSRKITDIFIRHKEPHPVVLQASPLPPSSLAVEHQYAYYQPYNNNNHNNNPNQPPDLGNGLPSSAGKVPPQHSHHHHYHHHHPVVSSASVSSASSTSTSRSSTNEARRQFLSSLAPLAACVSAMDDSPGNRDSVSTADTDYSLGDIDDVLKDPKPQPDIVVGTPGNDRDELALFVEQDASRIERLKKRYSSASDDEHDDYGFNRRPSVRGIKPRFGSTTEILQQMQSQITPPLPATGGSHVSWPYCPPPHEDRNGYRRYVEEPHYSQALPNVIHVQQGESIRLPYAPTTAPVHVYLMDGHAGAAGASQARQLVVRGTQTISTYYQIPRYPRGPLVYYPRSPICGSPTKMKLEGRGAPEGATSSSPHQELTAQQQIPPPPQQQPPLPPTQQQQQQQQQMIPHPPHPAPHHLANPHQPDVRPPMMYAMNV